MVTICNHFATNFHRGASELQTSPPRKCPATETVPIETVQSCSLAFLETPVPPVQTSNASNDPKKQILAHQGFHFGLCGNLPCHSCKICKASMAAMLCMTQMPTVTQHPTGPHPLSPRVAAECIQPPLPAHEEPGQNTSGCSGINGSTARAKVFYYPPGRCQRT